MNSFRSVSTKYQICSVPFHYFWIRSVPFLQNIGYVPFRSVPFRSVWIRSVPFLQNIDYVPFHSVPFRSVSFRFFPFLQNINHLSFPFHSNLFHSVPKNRNQFLSICCFLNVFHFPLRSVIFFVCNTNLTMFCLLPSLNRCAYRALAPS